MRRAVGQVLVAAAIAAPFAGGLLSASAADRDVVFRFQDPAILESSALVATDDLMVTTNDSGDSARVSTLRMIQAKLKDTDIAARPGPPVDEAGIVAMLRGMAKSRAESVQTV